MEALNLSIDIVHTLASQMLHTPLFTIMKWLPLEIRPAKVFHLGGKILEGNASMSTLAANIFATDDSEEVAKRLGAKAIVSLDTPTSNDEGPSTSYDSFEFVKAAYESDVATRHICEHQDIQPDIIRTINDTGILAN